MGAVSKAAKEKLKLNQQKWAKSPRGKYSAQKAHAKSRGIGFELTFEEWLAIWEPVGLEKMGKSAGDYCMSRIGDKGPYKVGNVEIVLVGDNLKSQMINGAHISHKLPELEYTKIMALKGVKSSGKVAKEFGISQGYVSRLWSGKRGKYLKHGVSK